MKLLARIMIVIAVGAVLSAGSAAAAQTGTISGTVIGLDGKIVPGARVTMQTATGRHPQTRITDAEGHFHFRELLKGLYDLRASAQGFSSSWHHNVLLQVGKEIDVELRLEPKKPLETRTR